MAMSVDCIHPQYHKENVADFDVKEKSKEFQKLSLTDAPQVPKKKVDDGGKQLEQKPFVAGGNCLYTDLSEWCTPCFYSPGLRYSNSLPDVELILDDKPKQNSPTPSTYSPLNPPDWLDKWDYKVPSFEDYVRLKSIFEPGPMSSVIPQK